MGHFLCSHMRLFTALIFFCLSLPTSLLSQGLASPVVQQPAAPSEAPAVAPSGTIERLTKQHILASIPPNAAEHSQAFLSSPSGQYVGYLVRSGTAPGAGGFGNDFCYVQVRDVSTGASVWESDCTPASTSNTCSLVFTDAGLEVFDGSQSAWDAGVDAEHLETLELVDEGDMRMRTRDGELAWKASDRPLANQRCGELGSPGMPSALPRFAAPIEDSRNLPFGQPSTQGGQLQQQQPGGALLNQQPPQPVSGFAQAVGESGQHPLVDNTPFDSGCTRAYHCWSATAFALVLALVAYCFHF
ncbi:hypothetical protein Taro_038120 [Colocasia esculenta]|uniref:Uncharacterized protein n=1 Tax=Colocasia esculenta TaxID=4460 RepID=A0A843WMS1_COLES|nr:hypothetical protein [Colocasia esculenta]